MSAAAAHSRPFRAGVAAVAAGVALHVWDYAEMREMGYRMAGMPVSARMLAGMALLLGGLAVAFAATIRSPRPRADARSITGFEAERFGAAQVVLAVVATFALAIDVMKPAAIGFVLPGLRAEYGLGSAAAGALPVVALTGTAIGSIVWGALADRIGRRPSVLLSALLFLATSICGAMPSFAWNLGMCFLMGASAGGLLPVMLTLLAEVVPPRRRALVVVLVATVSGTGGYLLASGAAALLVEDFTWRILWLVGAPTGLALILLGRFIPESPRFLLVQGREDEAARVMRRFRLRPAAPLQAAAGASPWRPPGRELLGGRYRALTAALTVFAVSWGLVNFGFLTWLPTMFAGMGRLGAPGAVNDLLATAALIALPASLAVALLYSRWSAKGTLLGSAALGALALAVVGALGGGADRAGLLVAALVLLIAAISAMNAMLLPYAAESYPTELRGRATGVVAGAGKLGGIVGVQLVGAMLLLTAGPSLPAIALIAPLLLGVLLLAVIGVETKGREMVERAHLDPPAVVVRPAATASKEP